MAESFSLGEAILGTSVDTSGLKKGLGTSESMAKRAIGKVGANSKSGLDNIAKHASGAAGKVAKSASGMVSSFAALGPAVIAAAAAFAVVVAGILAVVAAAKLAVQAVKKITTALVNMAEAGVQGNIAFEQYEVQFGVLIGSASLATLRLEELAKVGRETPFDLPGVVEADRQLQSFGLSAANVKERFGFEADEIRRIAIDVAAGTGAELTSITRLIGQFSIGVTGRSLLQLQAIGAISKEQLQAMGAEFDKSGELVSPLPEAVEAILTIMDEKYGGLSEIQAQTLGGMFSNLRDWRDDILRTVSKPIFNIFKEQVANLLSFLESPQAQGAIQNITSLLENLVGLLTDFVNSFNIGPFISRLTGGLSQGIAKISQFVSTLRAAMSGFGAGDIANQVAIDIGARQSALSSELAGLAAMNATTIANLESQIANAATSMESSMGQIAERFAEQAAGIQEKFAEAKIRNEKAVHDKIMALEESRAAIREKLQEKLADLDEKFADKRTSLLERLKFAETEADRLELEGRLALLGKEQQAEEDKLKTSAQKEQDKLTAQHNKELVALAEKIAEEEKMRDKQFGKLAADQAKQEQAVIESYNTQVAALEASITSENDMFAEQSEALRAQAAADIADITARGEEATESLTSKLGIAVTKIKEFVARVKEFIAGLILTVRIILKLLEPVWLFIRDKLGIKATDIFIALGVVVAILASPFILLGFAVAGAIGLIISAIVQVVFWVTIMAAVWRKRIEFIVNLLRNNKDFITGVFDTLKESIGRVGDAIDGVIDFLNRLMGKLGEAAAAILNFPMMKQSPTSPFEDSILAAGEALSSLSNVQLPDLAASLDVVGLDRAALLEGGVSNNSSSVVNYNWEIYTSAPVEPIIADIRMAEAFGGAG